jgi:predicted ArsR family transcriptional regulator
MRWWERQIGGQTRGRIIALLRRGVRTVEELAAALGLTDNAVRAQLQSLETAGIVRPAGTRRGGGAGKPATLYRIAASAEPTLSAAYAPVLSALLGVLHERMTPDEIDDVLREAGRRLAPHPSAQSAPLERRVRSAASVLTALGAEVDVETTAEGFMIRGHACPLSAAVDAEPRACQLVKALVSSLVGAPVRECCDRTDGARCGFAVLARSA